jgi:hypothetical protein
MSAILELLAEAKDMSLTYWGNESGLDGTLQAYIYALMRKYNVIRPYVTVESSSRKMIGFLTKTFKDNIVTATYSELSQNIVAEGGDPAYTSFVIRAKELDAFYFAALQGFNDRIIIFFNDPKVFDPLKDKKNEFFEYPLSNYELMEGPFGYYLMPLTMTKVERPILDAKIMENLLLDTDIFFNNAEFYQRNAIPHKRGVLMIGPPGNGKTLFIKSYLTHMQGKYGVLIDCAKYLHSGTFQYLGGALGTNPKVLIFEDVDGVSRDYSSRSAFLNFLDGPNELNNTLVLGTTNFPERLDDAILDRPSRFDTILYVGKPSPKLRELFLLKWFPDLQGDKPRLEALALGTEGFSGAYFKELFIMSGLRKCSIEEALEALKERQRLLKMAKRGEMDNYRPQEKITEPESEEFAISVVSMADFPTKPLRANLMAALQR